MRKTLIAAMFAALMAMSMALVGCGSQSQMGEIVDGKEWDANSELFGQTVDSAWDEIEAKGYSIKILSIKGAELSNEESTRHTSTTQSWRVTKASLDESAKTVTITVTSNDDFVDKYGESAKK